MRLGGGLFSRRGAPLPVFLLGQSWQDMALGTGVIPPGVAAERPGQTGYAEPAFSVQCLAASGPRRPA